MISNSRQMHQSTLLLVAVCSALVGGSPDAGEQSDLYVQRAMFGVDAAFDVATGGNLGDLSIRVNTTQNLTPATPKAQTNTSQPLVPVKVNFTELVAPQMDSVLYPPRLKVP